MKDRQAYTEVKKREKGESVKETNKQKALK
jgi:hypothetical protein